MRAPSARGGVGTTQFEVHFLKAAREASCFPLGADIIGHAIEDFEQAGSEVLLEIDVPDRIHPTIETDAFEDQYRAFFEAPAISHGNTSNGRFAPDPTFPERTR
jgi:hypothetical protein